MKPPLTLTTQQQQAFDALQVFLAGDDDCFVLQGSAGTGKSTLISTLINHIKTLHKEMKLMAPTGRAARVLSAITHQKVVTVHSAIYQHSDVESDDDSHLQYQFSLRHDCPENSVIIVDEASMLGNTPPVDYINNAFLAFGSGEVLNDLMEYAGLLALLKSQVKIIFVGDASQLPPVGETLSAALNPALLQQYFGVKCQSAQLTDVVRQAEHSPILKQAQFLREALDNQQFRRFRWQPPQSNFDVPSEADAIRLKAENPYGNKVILLAHTNKRVSELNEKVRAMLWQQPYAPLQVNDILMVCCNHFMSGLMNGDMAKVVAIAPHPEYKRIVLPRRKNLQSQVIHLVFRKITMRFRVSNEEPQNIDTLILESFLTGRRGSLRYEEQQALAYDFHQRMAEKRIERNTQQYRDALHNDLYMNVLQVKYGYALTCHKAQGGEWETAIVDLEGRFWYKNEESYRWMYTVITRARQRLWFIGTVPFTKLDWVDKADFRR